MTKEEFEAEALLTWRYSKKAYAIACKRKGKIGKSWGAIASAFNALEDFYDELEGEGNERKIKALGEAV